MFKNIESIDEATCENCIYFKTGSNPIRVTLDQNICIQGSRIPTNTGIGFWPVTSRESYCGMGVWYFDNKQKSYESIIDIFRGKERNEYPD